MLVTAKAVDSYCNENHLTKKALATIVAKKSDRSFHSIANSLSPSNFHKLPAVSLEALGEIINGANAPTTETPVVKKQHPQTVKWLMLKAIFNSKELSNDDKVDAINNYILN